MNELERLRQVHSTLGEVISQMEAEMKKSPSFITKTVKLGDARSMAVLTAIREAGGEVPGAAFETILAKYGRTLRGAGGFLGGAGASVRKEEGKLVITDAGMLTLLKWTTRYGDGWMDGLATPEALADRAFPDSSRIAIGSV